MMIGLSLGNNDWPKRLTNAWPPPKKIKIKNTVIFEIITFLIQEHFKTVTVTVVLGKLIHMMQLALQ